MMMLQMPMEIIWSEVSTPYANPTLDAGTRSGTDGLWYKGRCSNPRAVVNSISFGPPRVRPNAAHVWWA